MSDMGELFGPRILVDLIAPVDSITARAAAANLVAVVDEKNKPRPTSGKIVALGDDPMITQWKLKIGDVIQFRSNAGDRIFIEGKEFRVLETQEVMMKMPEKKPKDGTVIEVDKIS